MRGDAGAKVLGTGIPPPHQRTTKLSAQCLVQILHIIAEDGALQRQEVSESRALHDSGCSSLHTRHSDAPPRRTSRGYAMCYRPMVHVWLCQGHATSGSSCDTPCHALTTLARDAEFQAFALQRSLSYLQACQDHQPVIGAFTGVC